MGHDDGNGVWLWQSNLGWLWTNEGVYPKSMFSSILCRIGCSSTGTQTIRFFSIITRKVIGY